MPNRRLPAIWTTRQGFAVLLTFVALLVAGSALHMLWVKWTVGFDAYLGGGPRLPPKLLVANQLIKAGAILVALFFVARRGLAGGWAVLGLRPCAPRWIALGVGTALLGFVSMLALAKVLVATLPDWARHAAPRFAWGDAAPGTMLLLLVLTIAVTPLLEELFFRGFLFRWMASRRPLWLALLISSAMFGASHIVPGQAIVAALLSLALSLLYLGSGSLWPAITCHVLNNAIGVGFSMAATAGALPPWLTPPGS